MTDTVRKTINKLLSKKGSAARYFEQEFIERLESAGFRIVHPDCVSEEMYCAGEMADRDCPEDTFSAMLSAAPRFTEKENG